MISSEQKKQKYAEEQQIKKARKAMPKSNHDRIVEIDALARKEGLSYGQYVAKYMGKV